MRVALTTAEENDPAGLVFTVSVRRPRTPGCTCATTPRAEPQWRGGTSSRPRARWRYRRARPRRRTRCGSSTTRSRRARRLWCCACPSPRAPGSDAAKRSGPASCGRSWCSSTIDGILEPKIAAGELTAVIAIGSTDTAHLTRALLRHGIADYLVKPISTAAVREASAAALDDMSMFLARQRGRGLGHGRLSRLGRSGAVASRRSPVSAARGRAVSSHRFRMHVCDMSIPPRTHSG